MTLHIPVLLDEAIDALQIHPGATVVDATFGAGGHSRAILEKLGERGRLIGLDTDPTVHERERAPDPRLLLLHANFRELADVLAVNGIDGVDGVLFDLGVSSMQLDTPERGFSFQNDAPLDMRMDPSRGESAADYLQLVSERDLADAIYTFGEERNSRKIARALKRNPPRTTGELARIVSAVVHRPGKRERIHPATRTFQALRIAVNDELAALEAGLDAATSVLRPGGRLVAIAFHSLEDRIVKTRFRDDPRLRPLTRKPIAPGPGEQDRNPRARSAKLRAAERIDRGSEGET